MKIKLILSTIFCLIIIRPVDAQVMPNEIIDEFFELYEQSPLEAVDYVFSTNKWMVERKKDAIENVKSQLENLIGLIGNYYGHEKITEKGIGDSYKLISYLVKYDRQPLRFTFVLYKPKSKWQLQNFQYDDNLNEELEEAGKVYRIKKNKE